MFFASEIKALATFPVNLEVSAEDLLESLNFGYVHEPNTGFKYIKKVPPAGIITFEKGNANVQTFSFESELSEFSAQQVNTALERQSVSDVPLATFFSGGVDSSVIASQVQGKLLYINGRLGEDGNAEEDLVKELSELFERELLVLNLPKSECLSKIVDIVDDVALGVEEPISDLTFTVSSDLANLARKQGYTVMLSGMGADELFGGYLRYYIVKYNWLFSPLFRAYLLLCSLRKKGDKHKLDRIRNYLDEKDSAKRYARLVGYFSGSELKKLIGEQHFQEREESVFSRLKNLVPVNTQNDEFLSMRVLEMKGFLSHNLTVADKSSMKSSIELRVPFLDLELLSSWFGVGYDKQGMRDLGKRPLLKLLRQHVKFKWSPFSKTGFNPPIARFFDTVDRANVNDVIFSTEMLDFFDKEGLEEVVDGCFSSKVVNYHKLWQLVFISRWLRQWNPQK